eukprot:CAMPEP_0170476594 /NCGR_PEP_ID=MMETSP0123-20130129/17957_1 /TAXON_ID=182087 /ORGANISM="Favella ehrenbergii, Strain Fehren 1" /LENGTH=63 /DNA_ID=CAMNT_0010747685 /DNA_START=194 /DNA_END=385 /DNA_ORIENTATION=+
MPRIDLGSLRQANLSALQHRSEYASDELSEADVSGMQQRIAMMNEAWNRGGQFGADDDIKATD